MHQHGMQNQFGQALEREVNGYTIRRDLEKRIECLRAQLGSVERWQQELQCLENALAALGGPIEPA